MVKLRKFKFKQVYPWVLVIGGIIGLFASSILTVEKMHVLANPDYRPSCSISPVVACSPVMNSWQASTFKFPNMFLGLAGFGMVWAVGMMLFAGAKNLKKWFWWCFQAGTTFGVLFITWLQIASIYDIKKLCIYCMVVWTVTVPIFWTTLAYNLQEKHFKINGKVGNILARNPGKMITIHYLLVVIAIFIEFADYFHSII